MTAAASIEVSQVRAYRMNDDATPPDILQPTFLIQLIDRRTGAIHRINGAPMMIHSRHPDSAALDLMQNRDPAIWAIRTEALGPTSPKEPSR